MTYSTWGARLAPVIAFVGISLPAQAQDGIDQRINEAIRPFADGVAGFIFSSFSVGEVQVPFVLVWLIFAATFFTL